MNTPIQMRELNIFQIFFREWSVIKDLSFADNRAETGYKSENNKVCKKLVTKFELIWWQVWTCAVTKLELIWWQFWTCTVAKCELIIACFEISLIETRNFSLLNSAYNDETWNNPVNLCFIFILHSFLKIFFWCDLPLLAVLIIFVFLPSSGHLIDLVFRQTWESNSRTRTMAWVLDVHH